MKRIIEWVTPPVMQQPTQRKRVAAYARVSSGKDAMLHSLSAQISYYSTFIQWHNEWQYAGVYADAAAIIGLNQNPITTGADLVLFFLVFSRKTRRMEDVTA